MVNRTSPLAAFLILAASVTASVIVTLLLNPRDARSDSTPSIGIDPSRIEALESRIDELERSVPEMRSDAIAKATSETDVERKAIDAKNNILSLAHLEKRIHQLERRVPEEDGKPPVFDPGQDRAREQSRVEVVRMAQDVIMNPKSSERDKVNAHGLLRRIGDAYTPGMAQEMIRIGRNSGDAAVRAQVWTLFDGSSAAKLPELIPALSDSLLLDASSRVRSEAAEALGNYPLDPHVIALLEQAAKNDKDPGVRRKATRTLNEMKLERAQAAKGR